MIAVLTLALAATVGMTVAASPAALGDELAHDDGKQDSKRSTAGGGHVVRFERPSDEFALTEVQLHGSSYGGKYDPFWTLARVRICDESMQELARAFVPYEAWKMGRADWIEVPIGPLRVPPAFFVAVEYFPTQTKGIYQSIDEDGEGHSWGLNGNDLGAMLDGGEWMIRAVGKKKLKIEQPNLEETEQVAAGEGPMIDKRSTAGSGHAVLFKQPKKKPLLTGFALHGGRYGGGYDPATTFFHVFVCDKKLKPLSRTAFPYSSFSGDMDWVEFELPPLKVPKDFALLVYFEPTQSKGIYLGQWEEAKAASLSGLPGKVHGKPEKGKGWMIRARCAASLGKLELPEASAGAQADEAEEPDALTMAQWMEDLDAAELEEDVDAARAISAKLAEAKSEGEGTAFEISKHFFLRSDGVDQKARLALLEIMECAHESLTKRFRFTRVSAIRGKRIHLHLDIAPGNKTTLFTSPGSPDYSLIVLRGEASALRAPTKGGPHVVYGFCHELGHVLMGWEDSEHQWAHYLGSYLTSDVYAKLGDKGWSDPYDYHTIEGLPRFLAEIEDVQPGTGDANSVAKLLEEIGKRFGQEILGPAAAWIIENREGKPFSSVRLYLLADLATALVELGCDAEEVEKLFGE